MTKMTEKYIELISDDIKDISLVVNVILRNAKYVESWSEFANTLTLYRYKNSDAIPLPYQYKGEDITNLIIGWLKDKEPKEKPIDIDGSINTGFKIVSHGSFQNELLTITPTYTYYGK